MSESRYLSLKDKIHDEAKKMSNKTLNTQYAEINSYVPPSVNDVDEIKLALKFILEKLTSLDDYVRQHRYNIKQGR